MRRIIRTTTTASSCFRRTEKSSKTPWSLAIERELDNAPHAQALGRIGKAVRVDDAAQRYLDFCLATVPGLDLRGRKIVLDCARRDLSPRAEAVCRTRRRRRCHRRAAWMASTSITVAGRPTCARCRIQYAGMVPISASPSTATATACRWSTRTGAVVDGDDLLYILALDRHARGELRGPVVGTLMSNYGIERAIAGLGVEFLRADVGDRYVLQVLKQRGGVLGGEASGHLLCLDKVSTGDGIVAALLVLEALQRLGMTLETGARKRPSRATDDRQRALLPARLWSRRNPMQRVLALAQQQMRGRGRVVLRPSGTEPLIRVTVEGDDVEEIGALASSMADAVKSASGQMAD